jgi:hypothetical protein
MRSRLGNKSGLALLAGVWGFAVAAGVPAATAQESGVRAGAEVQAPARRAKNTVRSASKPNVGKAATSAPGQPFIEFRSRYALTYGHTFVVFGRLNARGEIGEIKPEMVAGLHPAGQGSELWTIGHVVPVPAETGWSDGDLEEEYVSNRFRVLLTEPQYTDLVAHIRHKQANSPMWHAALANCNLWTGEIAQYLGLQTGFHWLPSAEYIGKIKELNGGGDAVTASATLPGLAAPPASQYVGTNASSRSYQDSTESPSGYEASRELLPFPAWSDSAR